MGDNVMRQNSLKILLATIVIAAAMPAVAGTQRVVPGYNSTPRALPLYYFEYVGREA